MSNLLKIDDRTVVIEENTFYLLKYTFKFYRDKVHGVVKLL